ncbi:hypothetical protein IFM89_021100 [Coptis chinensis]|uniref:26S proteasome non-ATPase regulatory subunit 3 N-terminal TPR repeats domain-containing protein n=1 Tax=Coptis chinensis TaxID=261450 RepID=A0A835HLD4_9MAGN|nr:hypothetical protein IFM89_021100 [Coptis chinensis]
MYQLPTPNDYSSGHESVTPNEVKPRMPSPYMQAPSPWMNQRPLGVDVNVAYVEGREEGERENPPQPTTQDFFMMSYGKRKCEDFAPHFHGGGYIPQQDGAGDGAYDVIKKQRYLFITFARTFILSSFLLKECFNENSGGARCNGGSTSGGNHCYNLRKIVHAIRFTIALRNKLKPSLLHAFLNYALILGSEAHTHLSAYLPKTRLDFEEYKRGIKCRRIVDVLASRLFFYYSLSYELTGDLAEIRGNLLALHRIATLRHDELGQETLLNLLLRNYLHYNLYDQAEKLRSKAPHFEAHSNQQKYNENEVCELKDTATDVADLLLWTLVLPFPIVTTKGLTAVVK